MRRYEALLGPIDDNATKAKGSQDHAKAKEGLKAKSVTVPGLRGGTVDDWNLVEMKKLLHWIFLLSFPNNLRKLYNKSLIKERLKEPTTGAKYNKDKKPFLLNVN